jgi:hypothetical protein
MSFLKQLLTPFVDFEEDKDHKPENPVKGAKSFSSGNERATPVSDENARHPLINESPGGIDATDQVPTYSPAGTIAGPLPEHEKYFDKLIEDANATNPLFAGADFKEFIDSKVDIDDISDEALKYKTAFNIFKSQGLTIEKLLATGQEYLHIIGRDLNAFQAAHAQQYKKETGQKESLVQKKAEELQLLIQKVNTLKSEINQLTQDINLAKAKHETIRNSFLLAGEKKQKEIQTELQKIAKYFKTD